MVRIMAAAIVAASLVSPVSAQENKAESCQYQAQVVAAIQKARLDRVRERNVPDAIAKTNPTWPANYNAAIPLITPWVYQQKMRDIRTKDLGEVWNDICQKN